MKANKISLLLLASFLLLLASFLVLCTWGYNFYTKVERASEKLTPVQPKTKNADRDSLLTLYTETIRRFDEKLSGTWVNTDSIQDDLRYRLDEYYRVKNELAALLKQPASASNTEAARLKIAELQQKIRQLQDINNSVSEENRRLIALLEQLKNDKTLSTSAAVQTSFPQPTVTGKQSINDAAMLSVFDLDISPISEAEGDDEISGVLGSFVLKNNGGLDNSEIMIVVTQPNGKVLQKSAWESGTFATRDGKKIYSCKMYVENSRGEARKLTFSINSERYQKGLYTLQIYFKGQSIGKIQKQLS